MRVLVCGEYKDGAENENMRNISRATYIYSLSWGTGPKCTVFQVLSISCIASSPRRKIVRVGKRWRAHGTTNRILYKRQDGQHDFSVPYMSHPVDFFYVRLRPRAVAQRTLVYCTVLYCIGFLMLRYAFTRRICPIALHTVAAAVSPGESKP